MDAKTLEALKASIAKWENNAGAASPELYLTGAADCPLCGLFAGNNCRGCPIADRAQETVCGGTPYDHAYAAKVAWRDRKNKTLQARTHEAARAEADFLKSLLPQERI